LTGFKKGVIMSLVDIPEYGHHMTLNHFIEMVDKGYFKDYDGFGNLATHDQTSGIRFKSSNIREKHRMYPVYNYVVWFNR
jgi:hypothetical protein